MARFIKIGNNQYINMDQIIAIEFNPEAETKNYELPCISLSILTSDGQWYCFSDRENGVQRIKQILEDLRYHLSDLTEHPPSFWDLTNSIDEWLEKQEKNDG